MTRKDFNLIAEVLNNFTAEDGVTTERDAMAYRFSEALCQTNPNFDRARFLKACGVYN